MSDENERSVPDLGFFAGSGGGAQLGGGSPFTGGQFGGGQFGGGQFGGQFGGGQFGGPPATGGQFGGTAPFGTPAPFGTTPPAAAGPHRRRNPNRSPALAGAAIAGVLVLVAAVFGGRFLFSQFIAEPVTPDTLLGLPRVTDAASTAQLQAARDDLLGLLSDGSQAELAGYTDGQSTGYILMSVRGALEDFGADEDVPAPFTETQHGEVTCGSTALAGVAGSPGVTICVRGVWRRAVIVYAAAANGAPDPATVAQATEEAWDAQ